MVGAAVGIEIEGAGDGASVVVVVGSNIYNKKLKGHTHFLVENGHTKTL